MTLWGAVELLIAIVMLAALGWLADWIITKFMPANAHLFARVIIGILLLIAVIYLIVRIAAGGGPAVGPPYYLPPR